MVIVCIITKYAMLHSTYTYALSKRQSSCLELNEYFFPFYVEIRNSTPKNKNLCKSQKRNNELQR